MELYDVMFKEKFASMPYIKTGCGGSVSLTISVVKFSDFDDMIKSANLSLRYACKDYNATINGVNTQNAINANRFFHLKHAILDYSACYDYCLLIVYFAFNFCGEITSHKEYQTALKECRYKNTDNQNHNFAIYEALTSLSQKDKHALELLNKLVPLFKERDKLAKWANAIKHRGNVYHEGLTPILPDIAKTTSKFYYDKDGNIKFTEGEVTHISDIIAPQIISNDSAITELIRHNKTLCEFANWLYDFIGFKDIEKTKDFITIFKDIRPFVYATHNNEK